MNLLDQTKIIVILVCFLAVVGYGKYKENIGYQNASRACDLRVAEIEDQLQSQKDAEIERQEKANAKAEELQAKLIAEIQLKNKEINQKRLEQSIEAIKDPDSGNVCLGAASVRRLNEIK